MNHRFFLANAVIGLAVCCCGFPRLSAQEPPANGVPVHTLVTVEARHGSEPPVINREDVMVYEGHDRDSVTEWVPAQGDHAALDLFILLDDGSSDSLSLQFKDIQQFINAQPASARIGVAYMQNGIARIAQNLTGDHAQAAKALRLPIGISAADALRELSIQRRQPRSDGLLALQ